MSSSQKLFNGGIMLVFIALIMLAILQSGDATYRKPPFNGSIFGKRGTAEYDPTGKALGALCEVASEACQAWFPADNK